MILRAGRNCWRLKAAHRAACLIDADAYFAVAKQAMLRARWSILLLAWDFAEGAPLEPGNPDPVQPDQIGDLLQSLVNRHQGLHIRVLVWDKAAWLALQRRRIPGVDALHLDGDRLRYVFDDAHPALTVLHQKVLVVDGAVAFCGGIDFAANRWDTRAHHRREPLRHKPSGQPYEPHHDVMMLVDGDAARSLDELARARWWQATGERLPPPPLGTDPWPAELEPDFRDVQVGIARTMPSGREQPEVREVEALYLDAIAAARKTIYLENQYLASDRIGDALARRLAEPDGPEVVIITPKRSPSWIEQVAMDNARTTIAHHLHSSDQFDRFRLYAAVIEGVEIVVHSKVMVVDDRFLRIGSSNLNNRSMGTDMECDVALEVLPGMDNEMEVRRGVLRIRDSLVAEHLGVAPARLAVAIAEQGSLIRAMESMNGSTSRRLANFAPPQPDRTSTFAHDRLTDPLRPPGLWVRRKSHSNRGPLVMAVLLALGTVGAALWFERNFKSWPS
ncbi:phospholipase D-like domain-containing protein [Azospirillum sp. SYSU D00513]|uniref:phospholipase D-like domain-containing protein n=1 Tax=Azospirillum sp. SYSU D00513 TaxID=2812561 RepID=UPI001A976A03